MCPVQYLPSAKITSSLFWHHRIAAELKIWLPEASDEELYQRARRIVIAEMQNVVYGQWLREVLGPRLHQKYNLDPMARSYYKPNKDPTISNAFATAAFRFGHTLLEGNMTLFRLRDTFFDSTVYESSFKMILNTMQGNKAQSFDAAVTSDVRDELFQNIERGVKVISFSLIGFVFGLPNICWRVIPHF